MGPGEKHAQQEELSTHVYGSSVKIPCEIRPSTIPVRGTASTVI